MTYLCRQTLRSSRCCPPIISHGSACCRLLTSCGTMLTNEVSMSTVPLLHLETPRKSIRPLKQMLHTTCRAWEQAFEPHPSPFSNCLFPVVCGETARDTRLRPDWLPQTHTPSEVSPPFRTCDAQEGDRGFRALPWPANYHGLKHGILLHPFAVLRPSALRHGDTHHRLLCTGTS